MRTPVSILKDLFDSIEENLQSPLSLDQLAVRSGLSAFQLIRLFDRVVKMTPMAYVRARRLARSIPQLLRGDSILAVALDWGFQYEQSYIRAFQAAYGTTPARFRRSTEPVTTISVPELSQFTLSANGMIGRPVLQVRPPFELSGVERRYNYQVNLLNGTPLTEGLAGLDGSAYLAACKKSPSSQFEHLYLVANAPAASDTWRFPAGQWTRFEYMGLHGLDAAGVQRARLLMQLVIGCWFSGHHLHWDNSFIEAVTPSNCTAEYCEINFSCFVGSFDALRTPKTQ